MGPGTPVLLRSVYRGRVRWAFPHRLVFDDGARIAAYIAPGNAGVLMDRDPDGRYLERWARGDAPRPHVWNTHHILWLARRGEAHMLGLYWDEQWRFRGWYVNLQAPLERTPLGFDTTDRALDVWVEPDGAWVWKDESDLAEAIALGVLTEAEAESVRAEGERVIAERPWPTGWEGWRPPVRWGALPLPAGWNVVAPS